jgi:hypothetical protein
VQVDRLDVAYDDYPYKSWSLQRLVTGTDVAAYGVTEVTELGYLLFAVCRLGLLRPLTTSTIL